MTTEQSLKEIKKVVIALNIHNPNFPEPSDDESYNLLTLFRKCFLNHFREHNLDEKIIQSMLRKFNDAGRRSPPWKGGSDKGFRRPQDGADGNRMNRWLFDKKHEYYSTKSMGCLVEIKYILQTFSMKNCPSLPAITLESLFLNFLQHKVKPGLFLDPLTKEMIDFDKFYEDRKYLESGHLEPHAKGGKHNYKNATLMLRDSNRQQADLTVLQCIENMVKIVEKHGYNVISHKK